MTSTTTTATAHRASPLARRTGFAYLGIVVTGIFAEFAVRSSLVVAGDPTATASNIAESPGLFGVGIGADVLMIALDITVAFGLYRLLRPFDRRLALAATGLRLLQAAVLAVNLVNLTEALDLARRAVGVDAAVDPVLAADALDAVERHALGYDTGLIAFGLSCLVLGALLLRERLVGRPLAIGMVATGAVYLAGSFAAHFATGLSAAIDPFYFIAIVVEPAFAIRLIRRGLGTDATDATDATEPVRPVPAAV